MSACCTTVSSPGVSHHPTPVQLAQSPSQADGHQGRGLWRNLATAPLLGPASTHRHDARREARNVCCSGGCSRSCAWSTAGHGNPGRAPGTPRHCTPGTRRWLPGTGALHMLGWKRNPVPCERAGVGWCSSPAQLSARTHGTAPAGTDVPIPANKGKSQEPLARGTSSWEKGGRQNPDVRRVVAAAAAGSHASPAGPGARAELGPGAPAAILAVRLLRRLPDAVALEAPLEGRRRKEFQTSSKALSTSGEPSCTHSTTETVKHGRKGLFIMPSDTSLPQEAGPAPTFPGEHSVPSKGGPFLVLQK